MKKEEKELVVEWLDNAIEFATNKSWHDCTTGEVTLIEISTVKLNQFKADNDLIVKDELEFGRWICNVTFNNELFMYDKINGLFYGVSANDEWICEKLNSCHPNYDTDNRYATPEEIESKLSEMAVKMGYVEGVEVKSLRRGNRKDIITGGFFVYDNQLWVVCETYNILIMENGKWAKIISTPNRELDNHIKALTDLGYIVTVEKK